MENCKFKPAVIHFKIELLSHRIHKWEIDIKQKKIILIVIFRPLYTPLYFNLSQ